MRNINVYAVTYRLESPTGASSSHDVIVCAFDLEDAVREAHFSPCQIITKTAMIHENVKISEQILAERIKQTERV